MRTVTMWLAKVLVLAVAAEAAALDCERVRALDKEGKRASEIAREMGITTPDVQACLASERGETGWAGREVTIPPLAPAPGGADAAMPRPPNQ